jgi:hypothetical protein
MPDPSAPTLVPPLVRFSSPIGSERSPSSPSPLAAEGRGEGGGCESSLSASPSSVSPLLARCLAAGLALVCFLAADGRGDGAGWPWPVKSQ